MPVDVCQSKITSLKAINQFFVIKSKLMQNGGLQIMDMLIFGLIAFLLFQRQFVQSFLRAGIR